ncbi:secreted phosphoprotein 24 [Tupaia chinensis]|uniref:Secreted phosphoprotein 24 n=1 Tax=Tupaia chinensis TaxID=246437 RepID=L9JF63_TUPCH|nr:secreted phosphoprotein 24 [Tupaia chinensis]XP_006157729.1 secreted phosphoprotein 24 [Tupaia chinensis]ELW48954.1 Secreted phosphoprotein 24 [Tupaia chinensis]
MEKMVMIILIMFSLGINYRPCTGFPRYADPLVDEAFNASVKEANARLQHPFIFRPYRSSLIDVSVPEDNSLKLIFVFGMQKTVCRKDSEADPFTCEFHGRGFQDRAHCASNTKVYEKRVTYLNIDCHLIPLTSSDFSSP